MPWFTRRLARRDDGNTIALDHTERRETMARLTPITSKDQVDPKGHAIVDAIVGSRGALQGPFSMFLHSPEIAGRAAHARHAAGRRPDRGFHAATAAQAPGRRRHLQGRPGALRR